MADNKNRPDFIEGIYNYCDYICEKCPHTQQCYLYWSEQNPEEARADFDKAVDNFEKYVGDLDDDFDKTEFEEDYPILDEEALEKVMNLAKNITNSAHLLLNKLENEDEVKHSKEVEDAVDLVASNFALIKVKYHRGVHNLPLTEDVEISMGNYFSLVDSENTLLALKGFIWNMQSGCKIIKSHYSEFLTLCKRISKLCKVLFERIETDHLPLVQSIITKNKSRFDDYE